MHRIQGIGVRVGLAGLSRFVSCLVWIAPFLGGIVAMTRYNPLQCLRVSEGSRYE